MNGGVGGVLQPSILIDYLDPVVFFNDRLARCERLQLRASRVQNERAQQGDGNEKRGDSGCQSNSGYFISVAHDASIIAQAEEEQAINQDAGNCWSSNSHYVG